MAGTPKLSDPQQHAVPRISRISHQCEHRDRPRRGMPRARPPDPSRTWPARRSRPGDRQRSLARSAPLVFCPEMRIAASGDIAPMRRQSTSIRCPRQPNATGDLRVYGTARYRTTHGQAPSPSARRRFGLKTTPGSEHPACRITRTERPRENSQKLDWATPLAALHTEGHCGYFGGPLPRKSSVSVHFPEDNDRTAVKKNELTPRIVAK